MNISKSRLDPRAERNKDFDQKVDPRKTATETRIDKNRETTSEAFYGVISGDLTPVESEALQTMSYSEMLTELLQRKSLGRRDPFTEQLRSSIYQVLEKFNR